MDATQSSSASVTCGAAVRSGAAAAAAAEPGEGCGENQLEAQTWTGLLVLDKSDRPYMLMERIFMAGMSGQAPGIKITSIRRCTNDGASRGWRVKTFQQWAEATKAARGTANVNYGWYGASAAEVATALAHGFGWPNTDRLRPVARAVGVFISSPYFPYESAKMSEPDEDGERHLVLCRVVVGKGEKVDINCPRWHPSGDQFDSGVDDVENPRWYIVWGNHMNTHILPEYVVSFRNSAATEPARPLKRRSTSLGVRFTELFSELGNRLPSSTMKLLYSFLDQLKEGKISRDVFLRNVRIIAGEELVITLRRLHKYS